MSPPPARMPRNAEALLKAHVVDEFQIKSALAQVGQWGHRLTRVINDMRMAPEAKVVQALAEAARLQVIDLASIPGDATALKKLDAKYCQEKGVFPCALKDHGKTLILAICDPTDMATTLEVEQKTRCRLNLMVTSESSLATAIGRLYLARPGSGGGSLRGAERATGMELEAATTGEFTDHKGEIVGKMRHEERAPAPHAHVETPVADQLDNLFDFMPEALTPEEKQRLDAVKANQHRGGMILRAILELCVEKGLLSEADIHRLKL